MIEVSDAFKEIMNSNIRPKCEPEIKVSGTVNGQNINILWSGKNIKSMTYKRGIDPAGRTLPYMELEWTEIYTGKFNEENYPEKYANVIKYMAVDLTFVQSYGFYNTWKTIFSGANNNWKSIFEGNKTWKQVKNEVSAERVTVPRLFLSATPTIEGATIKWKAVDLLYFLSASYLGAYIDNSAFAAGDIISMMLEEVYGAQYLPKDILSAMEKTALEGIYSLSDTISQGIILDGIVNEIMMNLTAAMGYYMDFKDDVVKYGDIHTYDSTQYKFSKKVQYEYPKVTPGKNISVLIIKIYHAVVENGKNYSMTVNGVRDGERYRGDFYFDEYSIIGNSVRFGDTLYHVTLYSDKTPITATVTPVTYSGIETRIICLTDGEEYKEDNRLNVFPPTSTVYQRRHRMLTEYFSSECDTFEFTSLANPSIETGDIISVDTNLYNGDEPKVAQCVVLSFEITYNGAMKEKIIAKEISVA